MVPTAAYLRDRYIYEPETGLFRFRAGARRGRTTGKKWQGRYWLISVEGRTYYAHRLAWLYVHGEWPPEQVDHINANGLDNRIENLRLASQSLNNANRCLGKNNTSGVKGVHWSARARRWYARIGIAGKIKHLGSFTDKDLAAEAYRKASAEHFGEFARS